LSRQEAETLFHAATRHLAAGDLARAESGLRLAISLAPDFAEAHANLGYVLDRRGDAAAAESHYRRSLRLAPGIAGTHQNLGTLLAAQKSLAAAEAAYRQALAIDPGLVAAWSNLGALLASQWRDAEAEQCYRDALALDPDHARTRFNLGFLQLRQGRFAEGWTNREAREWYAVLAARIDCAPWRGEPLAGKALLIGFEAGHGDMIQFCRYVELVKARGAARVGLVCQPALKDLFAGLAGLDRAISLAEEVDGAEWDYWTPMLSLPHHFGTRLDTIPARLPYLAAAPERIARWRALLPTARPRIGLVWKGNPRFENDRDRSLSALAEFAPLGTVAGAQFVSLQKGAGEDEAVDPPAGLPLIDIGSRLADFADTAAVVAQLDLVVSVDTAVAHLAGALGKPCWVLLPHYMTDWRWLADRTDSPWYPGTMKLFRQPPGGDWTPVIAAVRAALADFVAAARHG
jgi:Flp pilus assembly protein TadD